MAFRTADRVKESTTQTGIGSISLGGATIGHRSFQSVMTPGDRCYYAIQHTSLNEWEVGVGAYPSADLLDRTTVIASQNSNAAVNFSAGTKEVFITALASKFLQMDAITGTYGNFSAGTITATLSGTASAAQQLSTPRNINGVAFDGTADITLPAGGIAYIRKTGNYTAAINEGVIADTTAGSFTITLPASPTVGDQVFVADGYDWQVNNVSVHPNGQRIETMAINEVLVCDLSEAILQFVFDGSKWNFYSNVNAYLGTVVTINGVDTFTNKTINFADNTIITTLAQLNTAISDADVVSTTDLSQHTTNTSNPHSVTKAQVGLGNVDNTSDVDKPVSTAQQTALDLKVNNTDIPSITQTILQQAKIDAIAMAIALG